MNDYWTQCAEEIKKEFQRLTQHSYIEQKIGLPEAHEETIYLLLEALRETKVSQEQAVEQIAAVLLVQSAFKAHEQIQLHNDGDDKKIRQLTILNGDLMSSLYYRLLSTVFHQEILLIFTSAIRSMNEAKMKLHFGECRDFADMLQTLRTGEAGIVEAVTRFYGREHLAVASSSIFALKRLMHEREWFDRSEEFSACAVQVQHWECQSQNAQQILKQLIDQEHSFFHQHVKQDDQLSTALQSLMDEWIAVGIE
ncbi:hypothetical protein CHL76_05855 [Marinococcus halophilus]|uniref:Heptaprenyl diphosphate synthase n=1 Tax=Marinococcus halophilus TaxID=1371 RepID=A0A510Y3J1_MARHA|nr:heptaprenyl diphosphate synthase component 1 [Marinococcus halophilus]OZT80852.1 hypothetical protein CHL76_05855 [Marinococcus halophilus]GEK57906.1 hypothetical protein MHA01_08110 [Marinococcus halophilus]